MRPEALAVRAVNQYRRRDIIAYLGLRYYLENEVAKKDVWAQNVATYLVDSRTAPIYFNSYHFKEINDEGNINYRNLYLPGPNEIMAETELLYQCSLHSAFKSMSCVYSYQFPHTSSKEGVFRSYFPRFRSRHQSIAKACSELKKGVVRYTDIRKFYPSIQMELAVRAWKSVCERSQISPHLRELGERLLDDHSKVALERRDGLSILTGPMFSHLIANIVLFSFDKLMREKMSGNYWRYVDDIVLVGDESQINSEREILRSMLEDLGFSLHDKEKDFAVDAETWLEGVNDFSDSKSELWMNLIANIKRFLIAKPELRLELLQAFLDNGISIPIMDYAAAVSESTYVERISDLLKRYSWFPRSVRNITIQQLVRDAVETRNVFQEKIGILLDADSGIQGYKRKRLLPKLRFYAGRLSYLATAESLSSIAPSLANYPEMLLESQVMTAIRTRDVGPLLGFGANAVQAAAQIFRIRKEKIFCALQTLDDVELQGIAILRLNGVEVEFSDEVSERILTDQLNQFASGDNPGVLMRSKDLFIKEIACLRGVENTLHHQVLLNTAFDRDEHLVFDVINQLHDSSYF